MARYLLTKLWQAVVTLLLSALVVFFGVRALPGDPALALAGEEATPRRWPRCAPTSASTSPSSCSSGTSWPTSPAATSAPRSGRAPR